MDKQIKLRALKNVKHVVFGKSHWLIREARSIEDAEDAIHLCICTGAIRTTHYESGIVTAKVVRLNPDGSEVKPKW